MANPHEDYHGEVGVDSSHGDAHGGMPGFLTPDISMLLLTWITFFVVLGILSKFGFKPILNALKQREDTIKKSLEDAKQASEQLEKVTEDQKRILQKAHDEAARIVEETRTKASETAKIIEKKAQEQASELLEKTKAEIQTQKEQLKNELKQETIDIAIAAATSVIKENLDSEKNRKHVSELVNDL